MRKKGENSKIRKCKRKQMTENKAEVKELKK